MVGTDDIRPGTPIKTIKVMKKSNNIIVKLHPATDYI